MERQITFPRCYGRTVAAYFCDLSQVRCEAPEMYFRFLLAAVLQRPTALLKLSKDVLLFDQRFFMGVLYHRRIALSRVFFDFLKKSDKKLAESSMSPFWRKFRSSLFKGLRGPPTSAVAVRRRRNVLGAFFLLAFSLRLSHQRKSGKGSCTTLRRRVDGKPTVTRCARATSPYPRGKGRRSRG